MTAEDTGKPRKVPGVTSAGDSYVIEYGERIVLKGVVCGVEITVLSSGHFWDAYFTNSPGIFEELHNVKAIRGCDAAAEAFMRGAEFVRAHQWQFVEKIGIFELGVRLWWNDQWGYGAFCGGQISKSGYATRAEAEAAGRQCIVEENARLDREIAASKAIQAYGEKCREEGKPSD